MSLSKAAEAAQAVKKHFNDKVLDVISQHGEEIVIADFNALYDILKWCKVSQGFTMLLDIIGIDNLGEENRFQLSYVLTRPEEGTNILVKTTLPGTEAPTTVPLWGAADWNEREVYDLMGITFKDHPDLRRILMWDEYPYHPLRKDFPLAGLPVETPGEAIAEPVPMEGGPFYSCGSGTAANREPHAQI